jgi:hypothetical protein
MSLPQPLNDIVAYFMTEYASDAPPSLLETTVRDFYQQVYRPEIAAEYCSKYLEQIRSILVQEFNERFEKSYTLRFSLIDPDGKQIAGIGNLKNRERIAFQDGLNQLSASEFEGLAALVLEIAGCTYVRRTPASHDQGVDAFGHSTFLQKPTGGWCGGQPKTTFMAQAKHYSECKVGSKDIREFVGSYDLALHKVFSTIDTRYKDLDLLPFAPTALLFITSQEIPNTVKRVASRAGIVVLGSDDLFDILLPHLPKRAAAITSTWLKDNWVAKIEKIPVAK